MVDFILALMPVQLIRTLKRSTREKALICGLMAMGLIAAAIAAYRISISDATFTGDLLSTTVMMSVWSLMETLLGVIAASSPCLKAPAEELLHRIGLLSGRKFDITRPSFVDTPRTHEHPPSTGDSGQVDSGHTSDVESGRKPSA